MKTKRQRARSSQSVIVNSNAAPFVAKSKTAFARHVVDADPEIRAGQEVLVVDEGDGLLATGKTMLSASEIKAFEKGTAVDVRGGVFSLNYII
ncbi:MAG: PUA domain-containing protein [Candidatus Methanoperedens sp.]|nr:PUA domain-containing protein [Candidatus Methanoperedens sp.]